MSTRILGIDPGITGAWALLGPDGCIVEDFPVIRHRSLAFVDGFELEHQLRQVGACGATAYVENVHAMPGQGVAGMFSFGVAFGSILSALRCAEVRIEFVEPVVWKRWAGLIRAKDESPAAFKRRSLDRARLLYPAMRLDRAKDHGRAEALMIAAYGQAQQQPRHGLPTDFTVCARYGT